MKSLYVPLLFLAFALPSLLLASDPASEGVFRINERGSRQLYEIDLSSVYVSSKANGSRALKLASKPLDLNSYKLAFREKSRISGEPQGVVFYPVGYERVATLRRVLYNQLIITVKDADVVEGISQRLGAKKFKVIQGSSTTFAILTFKDALEVLDKIEPCKNDDQVLTAKPLLSKNIKKMTTTPTDPRFAYSNSNKKYQWHLWNTGQNTGTQGVDINVRNVWDHYTGSGVTIAVADDGLEINHPDLTANTAGMVHHNWPYNKADPTPENGEKDSHGTSVGGVSAASWNNGVGGCGSAPRASLVGLRWLVNEKSGYAADAAVIGEVLGWGQSFGENLGATNIDVHNNSWGPGHPTILAPMEEVEVAGLEAGIKDGRGGLGTIYMFAAGNDRLKDGNANYGGYVASRYTIGVGAINDQGRNAVYSNPGCALIVSAPSSGSVDHQGITTTQLQSLGNGYTDHFGGTSSATPLTSGVVALILEANPQLGWRDVQEILIASARKNDPNNIDWRDNVGGFHFNHNYGAGMVDAEAAVDLAKNWVNLEPETFVAIGKKGIGITIPDQGSSEVEFDFFEEPNKRVENVLVHLKIDHARRQDLECVLISPSGMESRMTESFVGGGAEKGIDYTFLSTFCWGEDSVGVWKVRFFDRVAGVTGTIEEIKMTIYGVYRKPKIAPIIKGSSRIGFVVNSNVDYALDVLYADAIELKRGTLPAGLSFDTTKMKIVGVPTELGAPRLVQFLLTNDIGVTRYSVWINIGPPPSGNLAGAIELEGENVSTTGFYGQFDINVNDTPDGSDSITSSIAVPVGPSGLPISPYGEAHVFFSHQQGGVVMFDWKVESKQAVDRFWFSPSAGASAISGWRGFLSGRRDWGKFATKLPEGNTTLKWSYMENKDPAKSAGGGKGLLDQVKIISTEDYASLLTSYSGSDLIFGTDDRALWTPTQAWLPVEMQVPIADVLQASSIGNAQYSDLTTTVVGPGKISFRWRVSSEKKDKLQLLVGGILRSEISGDVEWVDHSVMVPPGDHVVVWRYIKDSRNSKFSDTGFISAVSYIKTYTYENWADDHFSDDQMADPNVSGVDADPNSNGISNLLEYAFGGNPLVSDGSIVLPTMVFDEDGYGFTYRKNTFYGDIEYILQESTNLVDWNTVDGTLISSEGTYETYRYKLTPSDTDTERFLRVSVVK